MRLETERAGRRVALTLWALLLGCAAERTAGGREPERIPRPRDQAAGPTSPPSSAPVFPDTGEACPLANATADGVPPVCLPAAARGRERTQDESPGVRVFEACEPRVTDPDLSTGTVDRTSVLIERSGDRPATPRELRGAVKRSVDWNLSIWTQVDGIGPCPLSKGPDPESPRQNCLLARSTDRDVREIAASLGRALAGHPELCIPIVLQVGVPESSIRHVHEL